LEDRVVATIAHRNLRITSRRKRRHRLDAPLVEGLADSAHLARDVVRIDRQAGHKPIRVVTHRPFGDWVVRVANHADRHAAEVHLLQGDLDWIGAFWQVVRNLFEHVLGRELHRGTLGVFRHGAQALVVLTCIGRREADHEVDCAMTQQFVHGHTVTCY
jgi:hypothetical protein